MYLVVCGIADFHILFFNYYIVMCTTNSCGPINVSLSLSYEHITCTTCQNCPFQYMQINGSHLEFFYWSLLFFISIVKNEFLTPKYPRIEVLVMSVAPQNQFYIETNLAVCPFTQFAQNAHKKIAQNCRSSNKAKFAYLPTQNTVPSKNLILNTMTRYPLLTTGLVI